MRQTMSQMKVPPQVRSTRFLIMSDTHNQDLFPSSDTTHAFREPLPKADVLLHCGDLTMGGGIEEYRGTLHMLSKVEAELKLVIAGNHDRSLDKDYWENNRKFHEDPDDHDRAIELWKGDAAKEAGVTYLEEGTHTFILKSGVCFTTYASPYQPEFYGWAFPYEKNEDRFNPLNMVAPRARSIVQNPVPDFPAIDILMTHGPPLNRMDRTGGGHNAGCPHLLTAVQRAKPRIHCFGHIHEGWGAETVHWRRRISEDGPMKSFVPEIVDHKKTLAERCVHVGISGSSNRPLHFGESTLMVNAAIMNADNPYKPTNAPWLVDIDLPLKSVSG